MVPRRDSRSLRAFRKKMACPSLQSPFILAATTGPEYELVLYVAGDSPGAATARRNLAALCQQYLPGRYSLEVVDLQQHPHRAGEDNILGLPCLVKKRPGLIRRLVGDFADPKRVLQVLGVV